MQQDSPEMFEPESTENVDSSCGQDVPEEKLPDDWRAWIAGNVMLGNSLEGMIHRLLDHGFPQALALSEVHAALNHPYIAAGTVFAQRMKKRDWVLECQNVLRSQSTSGNTVERRHQLSRDEFYECYYTQNRPVIITGAMEDWPALTKWTPEYLKGKFGHVEVEIQAERTQNPDFEIDKDRHRKRVPFGEYVDWVHSGVETNDCYLTAGNSGHNSSVLWELWGDVRLLSDYLKYDEQNPGFLWYGPKGIVTPLHHDLTNNFMAQIVGRKRILLIPPSQLARVYNHRHCFSEVDLTAIDYERFPEFRKVQPMEVILAPGELLFLPVGYWHHVTGLDVVMTITFTNFIPPNDFSTFYSSYGDM